MKINLINFKRSYLQNQNKTKSTSNYEIKNCESDYFRYYDMLSNISKSNISFKSRFSVSKEDLEALSDDVLREKYMILLKKKKDILPEGYRKDLLKVILGEMPAIELGKNLQPVEVVKRFW